jgi:cation:H+ antiporter
VSSPVVLLDLSTVSLPWLGVAFALAGVAILLAGTRLAHRADRIADQTGIGEALAGAVFLGATTSLPGTMVSMVSAGFGHTELAISNAIGGIAAQTAFLGFAGRDLDAVACGARRQPRDARAGCRLRLRAAAQR